jgi:uncharacterized repeat protein (TIGR01451 family)
VGVPGGATLAGKTLTWAVPNVGPGATASLTYQVTVTRDGATLRNTAAPVSAGGQCPTSCSTTSGTPAWTLGKSSNPASGSTVAAGDTITYTLRATNTSAVPVTGATATDDLTGVLAAADVTITDSELTRTGTTLTWAIPTLAPGQTRTVTYTAAVRADGAVLINTVAPHGQGGTCGAGCSTTAYTAQWSLAKSSDAAAVVTPGDTVHYTLTVTNTGPVALVGALVSDDVSLLVDDAILATLPAGRHPDLVGAPGGRRRQRLGHLRRTGQGRRTRGHPHQHGVPGVRGRPLREGMYYDAIHAVVAPRQVQQRGPRCHRHAR